MSSLSNKTKEYNFLNSMESAFLKLTLENQDKDINEFEAQLSLFCKKIIEFYKNDYRHKYSEISRYVLAEEYEGFLQEACERILAIFGNSKYKKLLIDTPNINYLLKLEKLADHISLELLRKEAYTTQLNHKYLEFNKQLNNGLKTTQSEFNKGLNDTTETMSQFDEKAKDLEESLKGQETTQSKFNKGLKDATKTMSQLDEKAKDLEDSLKGQESTAMVVMGMFTGIIMTFSGGFTILGTAFSEINDSNFLKLSILVLIVGIIFINVIAIIFYGTSKLANRNISYSCKDSKDGRCSSCMRGKECGYLKKYAKKYPLVISANIAVIILVALLAFCAAFNPYFQGLLGESQSAKEVIEHKITIET